MFGRKAKDESGSVTTETHPAETPRGPEDKKGRATPRRSTAQAQRTQAARAPKNRKEAAQQRRENMRKARVSQREALLRGDEKALPPRDRGPLRKYTRNYVDVRTAVAEFFLPCAVVILVCSMVPNMALRNFSLLIWLLLIVLIIGDSIRISTGLKRSLRKLYPNENYRGLTMYALMRSLQMRRLRLPKPQVKRRQKEIPLPK